MPIPRWEPLIGDVDGVNRFFSTPTAYVSGTLLPVVRGLPRVLANDDGGFELDALAGTLELKEAPLAGDEVLALFLEPSAPDQIIELFATIDDELLAGEVVDTLAFDAAIQGDIIAGEVQDLVNIDAAIDDDIIEGTIEVCG